METLLSRLPDLEQRRWILVTGKGGVGKSTLTGLLASSLARRGRRVLAVEADPRESLHRSLGTVPSDGEVVAAGGDGVPLEVLHLRPRRALETLVRRHAGPRWLVDRMLASEAFDQFAAGAPGLEELAVLTWMLELLEGEEDPGSGGAAAPRHIVFDAPASGHATAWLQAPGLVAAAIERGPVALAARRVAERLADPAFTALLLVTRPEELPVTETLELMTRLTAAAGPWPAGVVVNGVLPAWGEVDAGEAEAAARWRGWRAAQARQRRRLAAVLPAAPVELPFLPLEAGPGLLEALRTAPPPDAATDEAPAAGTVVPPVRPAGAGATALPPLPPLLVVVGAGGVGKTTLAAALAAHAAETGGDTLVMTFDPALRLRDALGLPAAGAGTEPIPVESGGAGWGPLRAALLDARSTFDELVRRHAPDAAAARRILEHRFYRELAGGLAGMLEYMAVERLHEATTAASTGKDRRQLVLDTPPTREALDFLDAPRRIVDFLDSAALRAGLRPWFDGQGRLRSARRLGRWGERIEEYLDEHIGLDLLRDASDFFQAFGPLYEGFRERAAAVEQRLREDGTAFLLVSSAQPDRLPDALYFARKLAERDLRLAGVVLNRLHEFSPAAPARTTPPPAGSAGGRGRDLAVWWALRDRAGALEARRRFGAGVPLAVLPELAAPPADLRGLADLGRNCWELLSGGPEPVVAAVRNPS